jgi:hypothetical protein
MCLVLAVFGVQMLIGGIFDAKGLIVCVYVVIF